MPPAMKRYAALDAWCTLMAWEGLLGESNREEREREHRERLETPRHPLRRQRQGGFD